MSRLFACPLRVAIALACSSVLAAEPYSPPASDRVRINIDQGWRFHRGDVAGEEETHLVGEVKWENVDLPHDWAIEGPYDPSHSTTQGFLPMTIGWYAKGLRFPASYAGKRIFVRFDGVYRNSDVWLNYHHLGHHTSGYTSFIQDITDYVRVGAPVPNGLRVRVDARQHEQDAYEGAGISRHVWLIVTNPLHVPEWGTFVTTPQVSNERATVAVRTTVRNDGNDPADCTLATTITDAGGRAVAKVESKGNIGARAEHAFKQETEIRNPQLWSPDSPTLYEAHTVVSRSGRVVDTYETTFGVRTFRFDTNRGFFLNGKPLKLRGFCAHQHFAGLGTALPDRLHWNTLTAMKRAGFNFYRTSHSPPTPARLDECDRLGMLVWDECERKLHSLETELELVRSTITRDRNHPSVILWSLENESPLEGTVYGARAIREGTQLAHELDPTRPTTFASNMLINQNDYGDAADVVSYNYRVSRADADHLAHPDWKVALMSEYSAARARRGVYGIEDASDPRFNLYDGLVQNMYDFCTRIETEWRGIKARPYIGGGCLWTGVDAWGEGNVWPHVTRSDGSLDLCLLPKDSYYYFVSQWTDAPMVHVFPHWTWPGKEGKTINVWGYTNCFSVELLLNGKSVGVRKRPEEPALWNAQTKELPDGRRLSAPEHVVWEVPYEPGTLRAEGRRDGHVVCTQEIQTAGAPAQIRLSRLMSAFAPDDKIPPLVADGRDVVVVKAEILDADGGLVPSADNLVQFSVKGDEKIIGVGNSNVISHEDNKASSRTAYNGLCVVIVQTTKTSRTFTVTATSDGLRSGAIEIASTAPVPVGLHVISGSPTRKPVATDATIVTAQVVDRFGAVVPSARNKVMFELSGPATFENGKTTHEVDATKGRAEVKLLGKEKGGTVHVAARSEGLRPGRCAVAADER